MISLTDDERRKFAIYALQESASLSQMAEQMEALGPAMVTGVKVYRARAAGFRIVGEYLNAVETDTISA